jgi:MFS transporter, DHA2 family, multidrug resistance protein
LSAPPATTPAPSPISTHPVLGVAGVLFGAMIATCTGRLITVGLPDLKGGMHFGFDEGAWISTAFNAALMFIGPFSVFLGGLLGPRRVLLACAFLFTIISLLLPLAPNLPVLLVLLVLAGLTSGTFYPLTLSFVLRGLPMKYVLLGIAMYALDVVFTTNFATPLEAWYMDHLSWHWIFWTSAVTSPIMMVLIYFGVPWQPLPVPKAGQPKPNWRGFLYASLGFSLLYMALDQGQRLDWYNSGTIVALAVTGAFLLLMAVVRRLIEPNPLINLKFLLQRNVLLLGVVLIFFRFVFLATVVVIPSYLGTVQGYLPLQTGPVLLWVGIPQFLCGLVAMYSLKFIDARLVLTFGFALVSIACIIDGHLSSAWSGSSFALSQAIMAVGLAFAFNGLVGAIILQVVNSGALSRPIDVLTFAGFFQTARLFGGEVGSTFLGHFLSIREQFHSNILGLGVQLGNAATDQRLFGLRGGLQSQSAGLPAAAGRAAEVLGLQVKRQAFTLAINDTFLLIAVAAVCCLVVIACMAPVPKQYRQIINAQGM